MHVSLTNVHVRIVVSCACTLNRVIGGDRNSLVNATCVHARTYASMFGDVTRACMAREILVQLSTDMHDFEKYSRRATKYTRVTCTRTSSLNRAVPYIMYIILYRSLYIISTKLMKILVLESFTSRL